MILAYVILLLWQAHQTSGWWKTYKSEIKSTQHVAVANPLYDYYTSSSKTPVRGGIRSSYPGTNSNNNNNMQQQAHGTTTMDELLSPLYKTPNRQQQENTLVGSNNQILYEDNSMGGKDTAIHRGISQRSKYENLQTGDSSQSYVANNGNTKYNMDHTSSTMRTMNHPQSNNMLGTAITVDNQNFNSNYQNNHVTTDSYNNNSNGRTYSGNNFANTNKNNEISPPSLFEENQGSSSFSSKTTGLQQQEGIVVSV